MKKSVLLILTLLTVVVFGGWGGDYDSYSGNEKVMHPVKLDDNNYYNLIVEFSFHKEKVAEKIDWSNYSTEITIMKAAISEIAIDVMAESPVFSLPELSTIKKKIAQQGNAFIKAELLKRKIDDEFSMHFNIVNIYLSKVGSPYSN